MRILIMIFVFSVVSTELFAASRQPLVVDGWVRCAIARFARGPIERRWNKQRSYWECRVKKPKP
jgi:hypothetical protein